MPDDTKYTKDFETVQKEEMKQIEARRKQVHEIPDGPDSKLEGDKPLEAGLVGLAFSGGGIRSATFNLGILQALGRLKLLTRLDYLSTVSGGGYIGAWLAAWIHRAAGTPRQQVTTVQTHLDTQWTRDPATEPAAEPEPVQHLREHSRYLALNSGILSLDMWSLLSIYVRNVFINLLVVVPILLFIVMSCRFLISAHDQHGNGGCAIWAFWAFVVLFGGTTLFMRCQVRPVAQDASRARTDPRARPLDDARTAGLRGLWRHLTFIAVSLAVAYLSVWLPRAALQPKLVESPPTAHGRQELGHDRNNAQTEPEHRSSSERKYELKWRDNWKDDRSVGWLTSGSQEGAGGVSSDDAITYVLVGVLFALVFNLAAVVAWVLMDGLRWGRWAWDWLGAARGAPAPPRPEGVPPVSLGGSLRYGLGIGLNGFTFGAAYVLFAQLILSLNPPGGMPALAVTLGPSLFLLAVLAGGYVEVVVAGNTMDEFEREWRSRTGALLFRLAFVWVLLFGSVVYLPYAIRAIPWVSWVSFVGWLVTTGAGFIVARRTTAHSSRWLLVAVRVVPIVFLLGLFAIGSELSMMLVRPVEEGRNFLWNIEHTSHAKTAQWWAALLLGSALAVLFVPATLFSLHALYMNRLTRCYLGASRSATGDIRNPRGPGLPPRPQRWPNRFTGFDPRDDLPLSALGTAAHAEEALRLLRDAVDVARRRPLVGPAEQAQLDQQLTEIETRLGRIAPGLEPERQRVLAAYAVRAALAPDQPVPKAVQDELTAAEADLRAKVRSAYPGPYPLLNTALNLVAGEDLAYQDRKGASFVFTPDYCGSRETGYARIPATAEAGHNLTLGRAMTISGAAVDPNMKDHQSAPLTAFLTILNARLGWWIQNPRAGDTDDGWTAKPPGAGGVHYLKELFGYTTEREPYVHLSDGGHFDASGAYELIRRRCRYVIAIDAAEDTYDASENLANLIRLVRADFGIEIEIDTAPLRKDENGISRAHCAIGVIRYDGVDRNGVNGTFVFIRSSITGDESADLKNYTHAKPPFPHHGTIDQFFDDAQFESYRRLGEHIGLSVFSEANRDVEPPPNGMSAAEWYDEFNRQLFANLRRQWVVRPASDAGYLESCRDYLRATGHLRDTPALHGLTRDLFPELRHVPPAVPEAVPVPLVPPSALAGILSPAVQVLPPTAGPEAELHAVDYLLQVMELAWMENDLENRYGNALNRGWMNVFRRWTVTESFHRFWPVLRSQYSRGFVRFCERALNLDRLPVRWSRLPPVPPAAPFRNPANPAHTVWTDSLDAAFKEFDDEFYREWMVVLSRAGVPKQAAETYLTGTVRRSNPPWVPWAGKPLAFALTTGRGGEPRGEFNDGWRRHHIPLGLVVAHVSAAVGGWELLVWIRGAHRTLGLARDSVPTILRDRIVPELRAAGVRTLHVRYPKLGTSHGDRFHRTAWEWFFNDLGFVRDWTVPEAIARNEVRLVRQL